MKILLSLLFIFTILTISSSIKISKKESMSIDASQNQFINFIPYDGNCIGTISGIGFGSVGGYVCLQNSTVDFGETLNIHFINDDQHVNLTSSNDNYCSDPVSSQIFKLGQCGFYDYSSTNYYVSTSMEPQIPKNSYVITTKDDTCESILDYWFVSSGVSIPDYDKNQTSIYSCEGGFPYETVCDGIGDGESSNCVKLNNSLSCFINSNYFDVYCT